MARYAIRDPEAALFREVEEALTHDERGYCTGLCLEQFHGGRHRSAGRHAAVGYRARIAVMLERVLHCETHGTCQHDDPHPGGTHRRAER